MKREAIFLGLVLLLFSCTETIIQVEEKIIEEPAPHWSWAGGNISMNPYTGVTEWLITFTNFSDLDSTFIDVEKPKGAVMLWSDNIYLGAWKNGLTRDWKMIKEMIKNEDADYSEIEFLTPGQIGYCFIRTTDVGPRAGLLEYAFLGLYGDDEVPRDMTSPDTSGGNVLGQGVIQWSETADNHDADDVLQQVLDKLKQRLEQD